MAQGARAAGIVGKRGGGMWGIDSPTHLGPGRSEEAGRWRRRYWSGAAALALRRGGGGGQGGLSVEERRRWGGIYSRGEAVARWRWVAGSARLAGGH